MIYNGLLVASSDLGTRFAHFLSQTLSNCALRQPSLVFAGPPNVSAPWLLGVVAA